MDQHAIRQHIMELFAGVDMVIPDEGIAAGDSFFFYDPDRTLDPQRRLPFATIVTKDYGEFDCASHLDRPGVYRLNIGVSQDTYRSLFGRLPRVRDATEAGDAGQAGWDYTAMDQLLPHPVYAPQSWVCVLNPTEETFQAIQPLLTEAYERAVRRYRTRPPAGEP
jgi:hypothetical protein